MKGMDTVSVVIVNWNSGRHLERCLQSLHRHGGGCEVLVIDNASDDASLGFDRPSCGEVSIVRNRSNLGFAAACNIGWRRSRGQCVLFLNPDVESLEGSVQSLAQTLEADPQLWALGGCLVDPGGKVQAGFNVRAFPAVGSVAAEMLLLERVWPSNPWTREYKMAGWNPVYFRHVDQPAGACLMLRRRALESLDGFDERFSPAWFEDVDLCRRIRAAGGAIGYEPRARFVHHGGSSLERLGRESFLRCFHANQVRYFAKHHGSQAAGRVRSLILAGMALRSALAWVRPPRTQHRLAAARMYWRIRRQLAECPVGHAPEARE